MITLFFKLIIAHAITDFAMQNDAMARYKSRHNLPSQGDVPKGQNLDDFWPYFLISHGLVNAAGVLLVTGSVFLAIMEAVFHVLIDFGKCEGVLTLNQDQILHMLTKVGYVILIGCIL